jgi:ArsR family transcriptional regulator
LCRDNCHISAKTLTVQCVSTSASAAAEIAWLLDLLVQTAPYAKPALDELDGTLLPGVLALQPKFRARFASLFNDSVRGCPELLVLAAQSGGIPEPDPRRLTAWLSTLPKNPPAVSDLLTEAGPSRRMIRRRFAVLNTDVGVRRAYRDIVMDTWELARPAWQRRGRAVLTKASVEWTRRLKSALTARALVKLMPPRHPLARRTQAAASALLRRRQRFAVVPVYFCMSGGQLADLGDHLHIGVPASDLEPARRARDAAFVADRLRNLAEPTRVHILIYLMSEPAGIMQITRALNMTQPTVSEHVRVLMSAGLVRRVRRGDSAIYTASPEGMERLLEDARATVERWR